MLGKLGSVRLPLTSTGALPLDTVVNKGVRGTLPDIDGLAAAGDSSVQVLVFNYHDDLVTVAPAHVQVRVNFPATYPSTMRLTHYRVDTTHSNAYTKWLALGSPQSPTADMLAQLTSAMQLQLLDSVSTISLDANHAATIKFDLPRFGLSLVILDRPAASSVRHGTITPNLLNPTCRVVFEPSAIRIAGGKYAIRIMDVSGRQVGFFMGEGARRIPVSRLCRRGVYLAKVTTGEGSVMGKIVRE